MVKRHVKTNLPKGQMSGLPDIFKIPDGPEKLSIPPTSLSVSRLIKFRLPPQRKSTVFTDPTEYVSELHPTVVTFNVAEIPVPPSIIVKALGREILADPEAKSIMLVHSPAHREKGNRYPLWLATIWPSMEHIRDARALSRTAVDQVQETLKKSTTSEAMAWRANAALKALEMLPWHGDIKGFCGAVPVDNHEDHMLQLLAADLGLGDESTTSIQTTYFSHALAKAYTDPEAYRTARSFGWLRSIGSVFATKNRDRHKPTRRRRFTSAHIQRWHLV
ncbi:hypothetical protein B0H17DRAFT_1126543 [Mycena rosella]|uniref:Uncharacterized protein n=1 Tax=Mycena rosella TaxID=1033263 RepID=A0AAD7M7S3_MYCRO|nr:hypothetical protein B0H17DRAFT_1126543 [Mycena rosella]